MRRLRYTSRALEDLAGISFYLAEASGDPRLAEGIVAALRQKCRTLAALPGSMGRPRPELQRDLRSFAFRGYVIFFRYVGDVMEVVDVLDGRRDIDAYFAGE